METRTCRKCGATKKLSDYQITHAGKGWRRHVCNVCESQRKKDYYSVNIEEVRAKQNEKAKLVYNGDLKKYQSQSAENARKYRDKFKAEVMNAYGNACACCGETTKPFLTIDHVYNDGNAARKGGLHPKDSAGFYRWLVKNKFPKEFQILCMNCNFGKSRNNGVCPHQESPTTIPQGSTAKRLEVRDTLWPLSLMGRPFQDGLRVMI